MSNRGSSKFFLTSAPFACGMAWLANALMKLGIRGTSMVYQNENWQLADGGRWKFSEKSRNHMVSHLPFAAHAESFSFRSDIEFFWEHRLNFDLDPMAPVIVVTRDPRDAIFSLFRRWQKNGWIAGSYTEFLQRPSEWPDHFPGLFQTTPIKTYLLFNLIWKFSSRNRPVLFVRFEDLKTHPEAELLKVFKFLKLATPSTEDLREAIASSSVANPSQNGMIFKGEVFEWKQAGNRDDLALFANPQTASAVAAIGYESNASPIPLKRFGLNLRPAFLDLIRHCKAQLESVGVDTKRWEMEFERLQIAERWAEPWKTGGHSVRNFLFYLMPLILTKSEIRHVSNRYAELAAKISEGGEHEQHFLEEF